jgi:hypothetical protein
VLGREEEEEEEEEKLRFIITTMFSETFHPRHAKTRPLTHSYDSGRDCRLTGSVCDGEEEGEEEAC